MIVIILGLQMMQWGLKVVRGRETEDVYEERNFVVYVLRVHEAERVVYTSACSFLVM